MNWIANVGTNFFIDKSRWCYPRTFDLIGCVIDLDLAFSQRVDVSRE